MTTIAHQHNQMFVELRSRDIRQVYLVIYSKADTTKFQTRESFAKAMVKFFQLQRSANVK